MRLLRLFVCCFLIAGSTTFGANLLVNGDFELPGATFTTNYAAMASNTVTGWTSTVGNGTGPANYYSATNSTAAWIPNPQSGSYSVQIDSSNNKNFYSSGGSLAQTVSLVANINYVLTFYMSAETGHGVASTSQIDVILNGGGFVNQNQINPGTGTTGFQASSSGAAKATPETSWVKWTLNFTPTVTGNVTLTFQDVWFNNTVSSNASLDNIDLEALPEMTPWSMTAAFTALAVSASIWKARPRRLVSKVSA
jgi:hypothetical protein